MKAKPRVTAIPSKIKSFFKMLGPGLVTGASDDDPSGVATYSQAGAGFGLATLWTALITFPLMAAIQEMCARIGTVTTSGLPGTLKAHYPKWVLFTVLTFTVPAVVLNIGADIQSMGAVAHLIVPGIPVFAYSIFFTGVLILIIVRFNYQQIASILKWLCLVLLLYLVVPFMIKTDWGQVLKHLVVPEVHFTKDYILILVAILGTTIAPYLFFWQATMSSEEIAQKAKTPRINDNLLGKVRTDVYFGMGTSNVTMFFIILTTGVVLHNAHITQIDTVDQAAKALEPLAGKLAYSVFALGIIGTGFLCVPVLVGSMSYMVGEAFGWKVGLEKKVGNAKAFYGTVVISLILGLVLNFVGVSPIQALIYTAVLYGITAPVMIVMVMHIGNNEKVMGKFTNGKWSNVLGGLAFFMMAVSAIALIYFQFK
jgi:NRAMP (natural resistance-associated macrophage protein)-like metal ion transporter